MSESELSDDPGTPVPPDTELEQSLRREVAKATKAGDEITVKRIRTASEKRLGLPKDFYKSHATWKDRSKEIVQDQVETEAEVPPTPVVKKSMAGTKRKSESAEPAPVPKKKRKVSEEPESEASDAEAESEVEEKPKKKGRGPAKKQKEPVKKKAKSEPPEVEEDDDSKVEEGDSKVDDHNSDSDLSVLIDEEPAKKKRGKTKESSDKPKKPKSKAAAKPKEAEDPDKEEIKRLQGWLSKCGIRKVWGKELKPYETSKAKIKHLKDMLSDAGMTGRYSTEKASQIKEAREMAADLEAVKEGDAMWGMGDEDEKADNGGRPQRKLIRGSKHFDFLSSDGEETD